MSNAGHKKSLLIDYSSMSSFARQNIARDPVAQYFQLQAAKYNQKSQALIAQRGGARRVAPRARRVQVGGGASLDSIHCINVCKPNELAAGEDKSKRTYTKLYELSAKAGTCAGDRLRCTFRGLARVVSSRTEECEREISYRAAIDLGVFRLSLNLVQVPQKIGDETPMVDGRPVMVDRVIAYATTHGKKRDYLGKVFIYDSSMRDITGALLAGVLGQISKVSSAEEHATTATSVVPAELAGLEQQKIEAAVAEVVARVEQEKVEEKQAELAHDQADAAKAVAIAAQQAADVHVSLASSETSDEEITAPVVVQMPSAVEEILVEVVAENLEKDETLIAPTLEHKEILQLAVHDAPAAAAMDDDHALLAAREQVLKAESQLARLEAAAVGGARRRLHRGY
jgi:hypothetical protein